MSIHGLWAQGMILVVWAAMLQWHMVGCSSSHGSDVEPWAASYFARMEREFGSTFLNFSTRHLVHNLDLELTANHRCWTAYVNRSLGNYVPGFGKPMRLLRAKHLCITQESRCHGVVCHSGSLAHCYVHQGLPGRGGLRPAPGVTAFVKQCSQEEMKFAPAYPCKVGQYYSVPLHQCLPCNHGRDPHTQQVFVSHGGMALIHEEQGQCAAAANAPANEGHQVPFIDNDDEEEHRPPVALVVGAMKAGTMTLWQALSQHPFVFRTIKEHHYFDTSFDIQTVDEYLCKLQGSCYGAVGGALPFQIPDPVYPLSNTEVDLRPEVCSRSSCSATFNKMTMFLCFCTQMLSVLLANDSRGVRLDASPSYLYNPLVAPRVHAALGNRAKIIVLLREPTARCLSHWFFINGFQCNEQAAFAHLSKEIEEISHCLGISPRDDALTNVAGASDKLERFSAAYPQCFDFDANLMDQLGFARVVYKSL